MTGCCVVHCKNRSEKGYRLFRLPRNIKRREIWIQCIGNTKLNPASMICEVHFSKKQFEQKRSDNRQLLRPDAIPDILLKPSTQVRSCDKEEINESPCSSEPARKKIKCTDTVFEDGSNSIVEETHSNDDEELPDNSYIFTLADTEINALLSNEVSDEESQTTVISKLRHALRESVKKCSMYKRRCERKEERLKKIFNEDQLHFLQTGTHRGTKWSEETLTKAVKLYLACGEKGYEELRNQGLPYPSIRTIQHRLRNLKFEAGSLEDIFNLLRLKVMTFKPEEKHAALVIDEMAIKPGIQYDNSLCTTVGQPTMNNSSGGKDDLATHALVFMLAGISTRWKQTVAYEFTGKSYCAKEMWGKIITIIKKAYDTEITVRAIISDMGPQNRSVWKLHNIVASRYSEIRNFCEHPCIPNENLFMIADPVHIFKNVAMSLIDGHTFYLNDLLVRDYNLPSNKITLEPVRQVFDYDQEDVLKLCPRLKANVLSPNHFEKMNVALSVALLNHDVAAAILYYISQNKVDVEHRTTAWFIMLMHKWFKIMTSRTQKLALSCSNSEEYENTLNFLNSFMNIVRGVTVDNKWKPFQTGLLISTQSALQLQEIYLQKENFNYLMLGRLTQDCLENMFSSIRHRRSVPDAREFKSAVRLVCLSQFEGTLKHGSYPSSDTNHLINYCDSVNTVSEEEKHEDNEQTLIRSFALSQDVLTDNVKNALYSFTGALLFKIRKNFKNCDTCYNALIVQDNENIGVAQFLQLREYKTEKNSLCYANKKIFNFIIECELHYRYYEEQVINNAISSEQLVNILQQSENVPPVPNCHQITLKLIKLFVKSRIYFSLREKKIVSEICNKSSRSVAMKLAIKK